MPWCGYANDWYQRNTNRNYNGGYSHSGRTHNGYTDHFPNHRARDPRISRHQRDRAMAGVNNWIDHVPNAMNPYHSRPGPYRFGGDTSADEMRRQSRSRFDGMVYDDPRIGRYGGGGGAYMSGGLGGYGRRGYNMY